MKTARKKFTRREQTPDHGTNPEIRDQWPKQLGARDPCAGLKKINATGMESKSSTSRAKRNVQTNTDVPTENETHELQIHRERKANNIKQDARPSLSIESNTIFVQPRRSPSFISHLIRMKNVFFAHLKTAK
jgi:hypothetical protein